MHDRNTRPTLLCKKNSRPSFVHAIQEVLVRLDKGVGGSVMAIKLDDVRVCRYMFMKSR